jgi:hypothetical protein
MKQDPLGSAERRQRLAERFGLVTIVCDRRQTRADGSGHRPRPDGSVPRAVIAEFIGTSPLTTPVAAMTPPTLLPAPPQVPRDGSWARLVVADDEEREWWQQGAPTGQVIEPWTVSVTTITESDGRTRKHYKITCPTCGFNVLAAEDRLLPIISVALVQREPTLSLPDLLGKLQS